jgi:hypothetical protein
LSNALAPYEYGIEIKSTINLHQRGTSNEIVGAGCALSECNVTINLKECLQMVAGATCWATKKNDSTIH